jgi:GTP-binding protein
MLIDEVKIKIKSGDGGNGCVSFDPTKGRQGLPDGGNGGKGGDIYLKGTSDLSALNRYVNRKYFGAEDGKRGDSEQRTGRYGEDLILVVPIGTIAHIKNPKKDYEVVYPEEMVRIAIGGRGGRGNLAFKSSTNRSPQRSEPGKPGEEHDVTMELRLIADIGFVGLPNTGKSSMLNELTAAGAKVANYPFTTLEPNLGVVDDIILADIPGLIEGASRGKGLGIKFLRHIQRTRHLVHFISADSKSPVTDYRVVRKELKKHDEKLVRKPDYIFISKSDLLPPKKIKELIKKVKKINPHVMAVSIHDWDGIQDVRKLFHKIVKKKSK